MIVRYPFQLMPGSMHKGVTPWSLEKVTLWKKFNLSLHRQSKRAERDHLGGC